MEEVRVQFVGILSGNLVAEVIVNLIEEGGHPTLRAIHLTNKADSYLADRGIDLQFSHTGYTVYDWGSDYHQWFFFAGSPQVKLDFYDELVPYMVRDDSGLKLTVMILRNSEFLGR